ncbi:hypothetical protein N0V82_000868 [Gnomoniopsis sp. IMI 355080]|nr:hypothetical protein N0V82_000868 [Gnomoniopsis sp. IMI 355080]
MASTSPYMRPQISSRTSSASSKFSKKSLSLDLSSIPPLQQPTPPSNTLLITNLNDPSIFRPDNLQTIKDLISKTAPIHTWAPLKSFRRILVSFYSDDDAIAVRAIWDGEAILGERCRAYFGQPTPINANKDLHLALPDAGKLFFISPPPSPPHDWEQRLEDAPNKLVHAEDLADALAKLHHHADPNVDMVMDNSPISPVEGKSPGGFSQRSTGRSRSSTLIFQPGEHGASPNLPCVMVDDMTEDAEADFSPMEIEPRPIMAHTSRPPVELMHDA